MGHILLLHGALGSQEQFDELEMQLKNDFTVHTFEKVDVVLLAKEIKSYLLQG